MSSALQSPKNFWSICEKIFLFFGLIKVGLGLEILNVFSWVLSSRIYKTSLNKMELNMTAALNNTPKPQCFQVLPGHFQMWPDPNMSCLVYQLFQSRLSWKGEARWASWGAGEPGHPEALRQVHTKIRSVVPNCTSSRIFHRHILAIKILKMVSFKNVLNEAVKRTAFIKKTLSKSF